MYFSYRTRAIITHSLYIFYPIFHCGLYCRAVYNAEQLIFHDSFRINYPKLFVVHSQLCSQCANFGLFSLHFLFLTNETASMSPFLVFHSLSKFLQYSTVLFSFLSKREKQEKISCGLYCKAVCITRNFSEPKIPRFIIKSSFKSRAGYNGARTVHTQIINVEE